MSRPNFFIIGAPKCGTTSLAAWLTEHPDIYMPYKEVHHFNTDTESRACVDRDRYERLFDRVSTRYRSIGEASVWYLYSEDAVPNIERYTSSTARYIVCLRNPIHMAYSLHEQEIYNGMEHVNDFEEAWALQEKRLCGREVSPWCREPRYLAYGPACSLGAQMKRLYQRVPNERVLPILLDDIKTDAVSEYKKALNFLNVEYDGRVEFPALNSAKERRSVLLQRAVQMLSSVKRTFGIHWGFGVLNKIDQNNVRHRPRQSISPATRNMLRDYFKEDVKELSTLLERDLSFWIES